MIDNLKSPDDLLDEIIKNSSTALKLDAKSFINAYLLRPINESVPKIVRDPKINDIRIISVLVANDRIPPMQLISAILKKQGYTMTYEEVKISANKKNVPDEVKLHITITY